MSKNLQKKAIDLLLQGATLLSEPCPYCHGVRVMKDGQALCISCGKTPEKTVDVPTDSKNEKIENLTLKILDKKLQDLSKQLENENEANAQQDILKSINSLIDTIEKLKKQQ